VTSRAAIAGIGATEYYRRGTSAPKTLDELAGEAIVRAADDAGIAVRDIDGFAYFAGGFDTPFLMEMLGIDDLRFSAAITGTGGGSAGCIGLAADAVTAGTARTVVCIGGNQQGTQRFGAITASHARSAYSAFYENAGLVGPGHMFALLAQRHMHLYGTTREHFSEVALTCRENASVNPEALKRDPLTTDDYFAAPMLCEPHCLLDFCLESDGAVAAIVTTEERARDCKNGAVPIVSHAHGGSRAWGRSIYWMNMRDPDFASSGHAAIAGRLYERAGLSPADIQVAQIYDHFSSQVIMQIEDYGFCDKGAGGDFVASGAIRAGGRLPINTDGGQLSCAYIWGMTHVREAVLQLRGKSANQVADVEHCLVTGGPSSLPVSALILGKS
jgi:acetyl-CoA acetyltransferase